jgi:hypothetical protein
VEADDVDLPTSDKDSLLYCTSWQVERPGNVICGSGRERQAAQRCCFGGLVHFSGIMERSPEVNLDSTAILRETEIRHHNKSHHLILRYTTSRTRSFHLADNSPPLGDSDILREDPDTIPTRSLTSHQLLRPG